MILRPPARADAARRVGLLLLAVLVAGTGARAGGALLSLGEGCLDPGTARVEIPLILSGGEDRPLALRTAVLFDPTLLAPEAEPVQVGDALLHWGTVRLGVDSSAPGRLDLLVQREGAWPLEPLPEGMLIRLRFRALGEVWSEAGSLVQIDRAETLATAFGDTLSVPDVAGPVAVRLPADAPALSVDQGAAGTRLEPAGGEGQRVIVRGRLDDLRPMGDRVLIPAVDRLGLAAPGSPLIDSESPAARQAFFYLTVPPGGIGAPALGFASDCRPRILAARGD